MRKLVLIGLTAAVALVAAAVAIAQDKAEPQITSFSGKVKPKNAGTKSKPKNALIHLKFEVNKESFSTLRRIEYTIPKTLKLDGTGFPTCSADTIGSQGESACPKKSLVGKGEATALLGPAQAPLQFTVKIFVAGKKSLNLSLYSPATDYVVLPTSIANNKVAFNIPERVQNPTGGPNGPYSYVSSVTADLGHQKGIAASSKGHFFVSSVGCKKKYALGVKAFLANNPDPPSKPSISKTTKVACKK